MEDSVRINYSEPRFLGVEDDVVLGDSISETNMTDVSVLEQAEEEHTYDAVTALMLNVTLIACLLAAYYVRRFRIYYLPESALALLTGVVVGAGARLLTPEDHLVLFEFVSCSLRSE